MQFRMTRMVVLVAGLAVATSACGKYSINSIRSLKAFKDGMALYQKGDYRGSSVKFEEAIGRNPDFGFSYFYLANSYDNQYRPGRAGEPENDALLPKAAENYRKSITALADSEEPQAAQFRKYSYEYLIAIYGSGKLDDFTQAEPIAKEMIKYEPNEPANYQLLGRLYEEQGDFEQAEAMFQRAIEVKPNDALAQQLLAYYYNRQGRFDKTMEAFAKRAELEPTNPEAWHVMGTFYYEKVYRDRTLARDVALDYLAKGFVAEDKAIAINPDYVEAVNFKEILVRLRANMERDPAAQRKLLAEADVLADRVAALQTKQGAANAAVAPAN